MITILMIDESAVERRKYCRYLTSDRPNTYLILEADNLDTAQELCKTKKPAAILLGFSLIDGNGLNFLSWLKQQGQISLLPTLLLVNKVEEKVAAQSTQFGIQDYLIKEHLSSQRLIQSLDHLLERLQLINTVSDALKFRKYAEANISESRERFNRLLQCSTDLIWAVDLEMNLTYLSPQFQEIFGWESLGWLGKPMIDLVHLSDRLRFNKNIEKSLTTSPKKSLPIRFRHYKSDGNCIWVSSKVIPIRNSLGDIIGLQGVMKDISDLISLAYAIRDRKVAKKRLLEFSQTLSIIYKQLSLSQAEKNEFISKLSCELRTSLSIILGTVENLQEEVYVSLNKSQLKALQTIESSENHLLVLINDILDSSTIDFGYS
ncbi:PAS domain S-box protein [Pseudanabaena sp. 'Roaring Creek']|uniref:PAS domain S-box protein n=1 Tax=Pseudanabaena sp. 'Roaring Creek' TaxID=1681830 RepID=UPI0006D7B5D3|nr:PAS domain S-box protein [Pseudanabaena sp. 'Roaring Creek']